MKLPRSDLGRKSSKRVNFETAKVWAARSIDARRKGRFDDARSFADEALEHAAMVRDGGKTVAAIQRLLEECSSKNVPAHRRGKKRSY